MLTVMENSLELGDGRTLHYYDTLGEDDSTPASTVFWFHGTPNTGEPPAPLFAAAASLGIRWVSYDRPAYGGSTAQPGRSVASAAADVAAIADVLGVSRFAVMGHSGGGPHALACGALLPDRVTVVVAGSSPAPFDVEGLDYFADMTPSGAAELRAAVAGRAELEKVLTDAEFDPEMFTPADQAALMGPWAWLASIAGRALEKGIDGMVDDDLAYVAPWGFELSAVTAPTLLLHGEEDRIVPVAHGRRLSELLPAADLRLFAGDGHVSVLKSGGHQALEWLVERAA